jgi:ferrochelatase
MLEDEINKAAAEGLKSIAVCPIGFATDHMEVLYDIDHEGSELASELGIDFKRVPTMAQPGTVNAGLIDAMLDSIEEALVESKLNP